MAGWGPDGRWTDHAVAVRMQLAECLSEYTADVGRSAFDEFVARFGAVAAENLASWCTGVHASADEMMVLAACDWPRYQEIMRGEFE